MEYILRCKPNLPSSTEDVNQIVYQLVNELCDAIEAQCNLDMKA